MIPKKTVDEILSVSRVEEVIQDFVNLKKRGANMIGRCPFHDEKTPSFYVSPAKGIYKCFGCGKAGTSVGFVMEHESLSYPEALRFLANKYNITVEEREITQEERNVIQLTDSLYIVNDFAREYFKNQLFNTDEGRAVGLSYFKERGYLKSTIEKFDLGYIPRGKDELTRKAIENSHKADHLRRVGLLTEKGYDFFRDRVMFTIHNLSGKVIAFAGRTLSSDKKQPKYINSPESDIYNKRKILYGLYQAKNSIRKEDECLLVEGYTDVITLHQGGIENVVASSGTALTKEQVRLIKRFTNNVKVIYDGDAAGIKAALRGLDIILKEDMNVRLVLLPDKEDPDSYLKSVGSDKFKEYLKTEEKDFVIFKTEILLEEYGDDPIKKSEALKDIVKSIALVPEEIKRRLYVTKCSQLLGVDEQILITAVSREIKAQYKAYRLEKEREERRRKIDETQDSLIAPKDREPVEETKIITTSFGDEYQERDIARILVNGCHKWFDEARQITISTYLLLNIKENLEEFDNPLYKKVVEYGLKLQESNVQITPEHFINHEDPDIKSFAFDVMASPYVLADWESRNVYLRNQAMPDDNFQKDSRQAILRFKLKKLKKVISHLSEEAQKPGQSPEDQIVNIKTLQEYMKKRNEIANMLTMVILE